MAAAPGAGRLVGDEVGTGRGEHPVCGDEVEVDVRCRDGRIDALRWRAAGCPASHAVAAVAGAVLEGVPTAEAAAALHRALGERGGLGAHERHAEAMFGRALAAALAAAAGR
ncbi:MAG: iron-sulfur cluster assembly scaffold protein [Planctomycetota bacterium]